MFSVIKQLVGSRKFWIGIFTAGANAGITQMNLSPDITVMLMKAVTAIGAFMIGGIAYEDGKAKEAGALPSTLAKDVIANKQ
ncbi:MAG TPA: hypothetical protein PLO52_00490 [Flavobacterium alvei]|nr:hypothetical protein [Flavobacterium alvei]